MSLGMPRSQIAVSAPISAKGTAMTTASGSDHFSYCAARIRKTMMMAKPKACREEPELRFSWKAWPVQAIS